MMGWFDFSRTPSGPVVETMDIPLFPLQTVLFPGSVLPLKIFEQRYLDMAAACMKENKPFGICLIASGEETGPAAEPHPVGTLAEIGDWEMEQLGILQITARGGRRFRILEKRLGAAQLQEARVEIIADNGPLAMPAERQRLLPLLRRVVGDLGPERMPEPHHFDDAEWVGYRITEILPVQNLAKQKLLELEDPLARLEILEKFLDQRKLLG
ncbi:LON peptidase substrate-binding domain-containing protein [Quatrionicoccus australiensis]|uniref:LON peptidase substrate-binding domain-containing protein n=1 Tax=Quatrionicoccus australiensis TaxID=138118 RepID=UPI00299EBEA9|nr:LON peptidase substrate-binding domain-containing protein [Quatrionicoccus australiensis]